VIVFCHEFLGDRWSFQPYVDDLRDVGFDLFTFDFRNHGTSATDPKYKPLQWVSDLELVDLRAALDYLRSRPDRDPAGVGLFGVSRGGGAALCVAAADPTVWGVVTDGAFPTRGTMLAYILRWAEIYVGSKTIWRRMPRWMFAFAGWAGRMSAQRRLRRCFPNMERAVARLTPRPWMLIHGEKDAYIGPEIAQALFDHAKDPKELWIVPGAKHNRCRELEPDVYRLRVLDFFRRFAPRRPVEAVPPQTSRAEPKASELSVSGAMLTSS
jgi:pimeloyl-ACP methyl ester carboxylesterase